jgi:hypothetical protein
VNRNAKEIISESVAEFDLSRPGEWEGSFFAACAVRFLLGDVEFQGAGAVLGGY